MATVTKLNASPSAASTYLSCPRKWGYRALDGVEEPSSPAAQLGTDAHAHLETWLLGGPHPAQASGDAAALAVRLAPLVPPRVVGAERWIAVEQEHARWRGKVDLLYVDARGLQGVGDFKTTSDLKWALDEHTILDDVAAAVYAAAVAKETGQSLVPLRWMYATTRGRRAERVITADMPASRAFDLLGALDRVAGAGMARARSLGLSAVDLPPEPRACSSYGGCPHRARCPLTDAQKIEAVMDDSKPTLLERLRAAGAPAIPPGPFDGVNRPAEVPAPAATAAPQPVETTAPAHSDPFQALSTTTTAPLEQAPTSAPTPQVEVPAPAAAGPVNSEQPAAPVEPEIAHVPTSAPASMPVRGQGFILAIRCAPIGPTPFTGQSVVCLAPHVREAARRAAASAGVPDYRLVEYGRGPGLLVAHLEALLGGEGADGLEIPGPGDVAVLGGGPEADHAESVLAARAAWVFRGLS